MCLLWSHPRLLSILSPPSSVLLHIHYHQFTLTTPRVLETASPRVSTSVEKHIILSQKQYQAQQRDLSLRFLGSTESRRQDLFIRSYKPPGKHKQPRPRNPAGPPPPWASNLLPPSQQPLPLDTLPPTTPAMHRTNHRPLTLLIAVLILLLQLTTAGTMRKRSLPPTPPVADHIDPNFPGSFAETITHFMDARSVSCSDGVKIACSGAASTSCSGANCKVCCNDCCRYISGTFHSHPMS